MHNYVFILGNHPFLSIAELCRIFGEKALKHTTDVFAIFESEEELDQSFLNRIGGSQKIYAVLEKFSLEDAEQETIGLVSGKLRDPSRGRSGQFRNDAELAQKKINFAINVYGEAPQGFQKKILTGVKSQLKALDLSVRYMHLDFGNIVNVQSIHEKTVELGTEFAVFFVVQQAIVAHLIGVQDIGGYAQRDLGKPERDMDVGLMPPKLVQMMINIAGVEKGQALYDPFCGTGGILLEGAMMGITSYGSDIDENAVEQAKKNLEWILKTQTPKSQNSKTPNIIKTKAKRIDGKELELSYPYLKASKHQLFVKDARKLDSISFPFDAVVTEGYLGPILKREVTPNQLAHIEGEINVLYQAFFEAIARYAAKRHAAIVCCLPFYIVDEKPVTLQKPLESILALGYTASDLVPGWVYQRLGVVKNKRKSLLYARKNQHVGREIFLFRLGK